MKFQDSSFNGLKVTVGTKSLTHPRTHPPTHPPTHARTLQKQYAPSTFSKLGALLEIVFVKHSAPTICLPLYCTYKGGGGGLWSDLIQELKILFNTNRFREGMVDLNQG